MTSPLGKDLLGLAGLSREQITTILDVAEPLKEISERTIKKVPTLRGMTVVNLFFEPSTRTRISFEFAEKRMSADTVNVAARLEELASSLQGDAEAIVLASGTTAEQADGVAPLKSLGPHILRGRSGVCEVWRLVPEHK